MSFSQKEIILSETEIIDRAWQECPIEDLYHFQLDFTIPPHHQRGPQLTSYSLFCRTLTMHDFPTDHLIITDEYLLKLDWLQDLIASRQHIIPLQADENRVKDVDFLNTCLRSMQTVPCLIGIGGGTMLNSVGYLAEQLKSDVIYIPTTPLAMCDSSIGGKVRVNRMVNGEFEKHYYRSFYEPNKIIVEPRFLDSLRAHDCSTGIAEIVKHALYQSKGLLDYLLSPAFQPQQDKKSLLKAILWTCDLKRLCLEIDPDEKPEGSYDILRAAHNTADRFEEDHHFKVTHGEAVWFGMEQELGKDKIRGEKFNELKRKIFAL